MLEVYSSLSRQSDSQNQNEGGNPAWYQHSNYSIYNQNGRLLKRVINTSGGNIPSLEVMASSPFITGLNKNYSAGGKWDMMRGSPFQKDAQDLALLQHQYAWNVMHPGDPQNANMADEKRKIDGLIGPNGILTRAGLNPNEQFDKM